MIRWRFILTRIVVIAAIIILLRWGLGPVANYVTIRGLESVTGAKVEIAKTRVGLFPPSVQYVDFCVADPRDEKELRDAFRADSIELKLDGDAILHRRWIANEGKIAGLKVGALRESSGHLERLDDHSPSNDGPSMLSRLVGAAGDKLSDEASDVVDGLELSLIHI